VSALCESGHELPSESSGGAGYEYLHDISFSGFTPTETRSRPWL
jgi:hypothetical protein